MLLPSNWSAPAPFDRLRRHRGRPHSQGLHWLLTDQQASHHVAINDATGGVTRSATPYGAHRAPKPPAHRPRLPLDEEDTTGLVDNRYYRSASAEIGGRTRIFDGLNSVAVSEVKNVKYQSLTLQLRDSLAYAEANGLRFDLYVRGGVNPATLSRPLQEAIASNPRFNLEFIP